MVNLLKCVWLLCTSASVKSIKNNLEQTKIRDLSNHGFLATSLYH